MIVEHGFLNWERLLSSARVLVCHDQEDHVKVSMARKSHEKNDYRSPFERDYCHIIYSSAFRRLGRKTQVHPFPAVDYVRFRLTHSLEVSTIAASLIKHVHANFIEKYATAPFNLDDASWVLRTAGLSHDIGNPPYGHAGERGIRNWAKKQQDFESERIKNDFIYFDGNAETFHLLSRNDLRPGLFNRLTAASLGAIVKYPYLSDKATDEHAKFGAFDVDREVFDAVMDELGLKTADGYLRHPLSFLLEAADDISYNLSDLEDGVKMKAIDQEPVIELFEELMPGMEKKSDGNPKKWAGDKRIGELRSAAAGRLIAEYATVFFEKYTSIMNGELKSGSDYDAFLPGNIRDWLNKSRHLRKQIYNDTAVISAEDEGQKESSDLLDEYMSLLKYSEESIEISLDKKDLVVTILGDQFPTIRGSRPKTWWRHVILDYIVGMTDDHMKSAHQNNAK